MRAWQVVIPVILVACGASAQQAGKTQTLPNITTQGSNAIGANSAKGGNEVTSGEGDSTMADLLSRAFNLGEAKAKNPPRRRGASKSSLSNGLQAA